MKKELGEIVTFEKKSKRRASEGKKSGEHRFFTSSAIQNMFIDDYDHKGEYLIIGTGGLPSIHYCNEPFSTSADCYVIKCENSRVQTKYIYYYLSKNIHILEKGFRGVGLKHINKNYINNIKIPLLSPKEQEKIIFIFDKIESINKNRDKIDSLTDDFLKSSFFNLFGDPIQNEKRWITKKMSEVCNIRRGASPRPIDKHLGGNIPWIKIGDATNRDGLYIDSTKECIKEESVKYSVFLKNGTLIFANSGVSLGFARILKIDGCIHDGWLAFEDINENVNEIYLLKLLNFLTDFFRVIAPEGTQPNLNTKIMKKFVIPIPDLSLQTTYVDLVKKIELLKENFFKYDDLLCSFDNYIVDNYF